MAILEVSLAPFWYQNVVPGMTLGVPGLTLEVPGDILGGKSASWGPVLAPFWHQKVMKKMFENGIEKCMEKKPTKFTSGIFGRRSEGENDDYMQLLLLFIENHVFP